MRKGWTREDSLRVAYLVAAGHLICEVYKGRDTEDIPDRLKSLLAELGAYDKQQERSDDPLLTQNARHRRAPPRRASRSGGRRDLETRDPRNGAGFACVLLPQLGYGSVMAHLSPSGQKLR